MKEEAKNTIQTLGVARFPLIERKCLKSRKLRRLLPRLIRMKPAVRFSAATGENCHSIATLCPAEHDDIPAPNFIGAQLKSIPELSRNLSPAPSVELIEIADGTVRGMSGLIETADRILHHDLIEWRTQRIADENRPSFALDLEAHRLGFIRNRNPTSLDRAVALTDCLASNYAHWLTEVLPKVALIEQSGLLPDSTFLIDANLHANQYRSLSLLVGNNRSVSLLPHDRQVTVRQLYAVTPPGYIPFEPRGPMAAGHPHGIFSKNAMGTMVKAIQAALGVNPAKLPGRRLLVKRNSTYRTLLNEVCLEDLLSDLGFEVVEPDKMSFDEQVRVFSAATAIVGASGAAMANLIWARPDCRTCILIAQNLETPYGYWASMAAAVGGRVSYLLGRPGKVDSTDVHADFLMPFKQLDRLRNLFRPTGGHRPPPLDMSRRSEQEAIAAQS